MPNYDRQKRMTMMMTKKVTMMVTMIVIVIQKVALKKLHLIIIKH